MHRSLTIVGLLLFLTIVGTVGFRLIEGGSWLDCLYMTVITLTTVGFEHTLEPSDAGKIFIIGFLVVGLSVFTYSIYSLGHWITNAQVRTMLERRRMDRRIEQVRNHCIICGHGRMGLTIAEYLSGRKKPFVIIDIDEDAVKSVCAERGWLYVVGDATDDEVLETAGITRAKSLAAVLPTDADNVYVVLSARMLAADLQIIARATEEKAIQKLERAGASRVVSPLSSGALKIARFMLTPGLEDFLEVADAHGNGFELADVQITEDSPYIGRTLMETDLREQGIMVIGIRRANGERLLPPPGTATIQAGDSLFAVGSSEAVNAISAQQQD